MKIRAARAFLALLINSLLLADHPARAETADDASPRMRLRGIELAVDIDYAAEKLTGTAALDIENVSDASEPAVSLLLNRLMHFDRIETPDGSAIPFRQEIVTFPDSPKRQVNRALLRMPAPIEAHSRARVRVAYSGYLVGYTETGSLYIQDSIDPDFTIIRTDAYAFPVVAVASDQKNRSIAPADFPFDLRVTVPGDLTVADGGELVEKTPAGPKITWHYRSTSPVPFLNFAIAKYDLAEKDGIRLYSFPKDQEGAVRVMDSARRALDLFRAWFGPTAAPPRFAVIEIPANFGSQASLSGGIIRRRPARSRAATRLSSSTTRSRTSGIPSTSIRRLPGSTRASRCICNFAPRGRSTDGPISTRSSKRGSAGWSTRPGRNRGSPRRRWRTSERPT